jgi:hypothetical protein
MDRVHAHNAEPILEAHFSARLWPLLELPVVGHLVVAVVVKGPMADAANHVLLLVLLYLAIHHP